MMKISVAAIAILLLAASLCSARRIVDGSKGAPGTERWTWTNPYKGGGFFSGATATYSTIYTGAGDGFLYSISKQDGHVIWAIGNASHPIKSTPTICRSCGTDGRIFFGDSGSATGPRGSIHSNGLDEGYAKWYYITNGSVVGRPYVYNNYVLTSCEDGVIRANDEAAGHLIWEYPTGSKFTAGIQIYNGLAIVGAENGVIYAVDPMSGDLVWSFPTDSPITSNVVFYAPSIYVGTTGGHVYALDGTQGVQLWKVAVGGSITGRMAVSNGYLYVPSLSGSLTCLDSMTGASRFIYNAGKPLSAAVTATTSTNEPQVIFGSMGGILYSVFALNGTLNWQYNAQSGPISTEPLVEDYIFFGTEGGKFISLYLYSEK